MRLLILTICVFIQLNSKAKINITTKQEDYKHVTQKIDQLKNKIPYFRTLIKKLEESPQIFTITIHQSKHLALFQPTKQGGKINFSSLKILNDDNAVLEEFFHAFQHLYYKLPLKLKKGGSNIEFEAKLFRAIVYIEQGLPMNETPSQKGLLDFVLGMLDQNGHFQTHKFNTTQQQKYISCVRHFQQHWEQRNKDENHHSIYSQTVVGNWMPDALFFLLNH